MGGGEWDWGIVEGQIRPTKGVSDRLPERLGEGPGSLSDTLAPL